MTQLHKIVATMPAAKRELYDVMQHYIQAMSNNKRVDGLVQTYEPFEETNEVHDPEEVPVQIRTTEAVTDVRSSFIRCGDIGFSLDSGNSKATGTIRIHGQEAPLASDVPVTHLLWLEKRLVELEHFIRAIPELRPDISGWELDKQNGYYVAPAQHRTRTKKLQKPLTLAPSTDKFPAQVQLITEDVAVGTVKTVARSGAVPSEWKRHRLERIATLREAVVAARIEANAYDASATAGFAEKVFDFVFDEEIS